MAKKLNFNEVADPKLLQPLIDQLETVKGLMTDIAKEGAKIAKQTPLDSYDNIQKVEKGITDVKEAVTELDAIEKQRAKLQQRQKQLEDERAQGLANLRLEVQQQNKELRDNAKAAAESNNAFKVLTKNTNDAQAEFKKLAAQFGVTSKEAQEAKEKFDDLDEELTKVNKAARDGRRDVGRYEQATKKLNNTLGKLGFLVILVKAFEALSEAWNQNSEAAAESEKVISRWAITFRVVISRVSDVLPALQNIFSKAFDNIAISFDRLGLKFEKFLTNLELLVTFGDNTEELEKKIAKLDEQISDTNYKDFSKDIDTVSNAFNGMGAEIDELAKKNDVLIDRTLQYRKEIIALQKSVALLNKEREASLAISEDDTRSLEEQLEASKEVAKINEEIDKQTTDIASKRLELATLNAQINKDNIDAQEELAAAFVEFQDVIIEAETRRVEASIRQRAILLDLFDENLDDLVDFADNSKTINERIAADEKESLANRERVLNEAVRNQEVAFNAQIKLFEDIENERKRLIAEQEGEAFIPFSFDVDEFLSIEDTVELNRRIKTLDLTERQRIRLLELIREERTAQKDLAEANNDLNDSRAETLEINKDIILQEEALLTLQSNAAGTTKALEKLENDRRQVEKANLQSRIDDLEEGSLERLRLQQELNDLLLEDQEKANQKQLDQQQELAEKSIAVVRDFFQKRNEERLAAIDGEISAEEERERRLEELAAKGIQSAEENLAENQKRQAELEAQRQRAIQQQAKQELALTAIEVYGQKVAADDPNPLASTITDIEILKAFVQSLPAFYEGSERVGDDLNPFMSGKDGHVIRVDGDERILNPTQSKMIPNNMSNLELAMMAQNSVNTDQSSVRDLYLMNLGSKMDQVAAEIRNKPTYLGRDFDANKNAIVDTIERKGKLERYHRKTGGVWGNKKG